MSTSATKKKVMLAMSGGIDSSVAAILLKKQGFDIVGVTYRVWDYISESCMSKETGCCSVENIFEAKKLAENLGFEHHIVDFRNLFHQTIIADFINEYSTGRTPNPCVLCNSKIKWGELLKFANQHKCDFIATGHYAKIVYESERYFLSKGKDTLKDQSYFLWKLSQENLSKTLFPLGNLDKHEVREIARENGYEKISKKKESQEICFVPDDDYRRFLKENISNFEEKFKPGNFVSEQGKILGRHQGIPFYTIGQRKGLKIATGSPVYITRIDLATNNIILGNADELKKQKLSLKNINLMKYKKLTENFRAEVKIRYRNSGNFGTLNQTENGIDILFDTPVSAITPGQSAVFYEGNHLIGGGIIE